MSNIRYGLLPFGIKRYGEGVQVIAGPDPGDGTGGSVLPDDKIHYLPNCFTVIAYAPDGTKTAIYGAGAENNDLQKVTFELVETGCGSIEMVFGKLPQAGELTYRQRVDVHLFNDPRPWYSGYVISRPVEGTTEAVFRFTGHGYYNLLDKVIINKTYEHREISEIVADIARQVEHVCGLTFNGNKIINTAYRAERIVFDHVPAKEALKQLSDFAVDYVYGIDAYRQLYFRPRVNEVNEQARFWVGQHIGQYLPAWDVEKIVNHAYIKGGKVDENGELWLAEVKDEDSQERYGLQEAVWTLPSAYAAEDAARWGQNQIDRYKEPKQSAKVSGVRLEYPKPSGVFFVRKLTTQGKAAITTLDGSVHTYPIKTLKYSAEGRRGIELNMELGEPRFEVDRYLFNIERSAKVAELLQLATTKQLKGGK